MRRALLHARETWLTINTKIPGPHEGQIDFQRERCEERVRERADNVRTMLTHTPYAGLQGLFSIPAAWCVAQLPW